MGSCGGADRPPRPAYGVILTAADSPASVHVVTPEILEIAPSGGVSLSPQSQASTNFALDTSVKQQQIGAKTTRFEEGAVCVS